jgi:hypothetical protein
VYLEVELRKGDNPKLLEQKSEHIRPGATRTLESADAYWQRFNSYNDTKNGGS